MIGSSNSSGFSSLHSSLCNEGDARIGSSNSSGVSSIRSGSIHSGQCDGRNGGQYGCSSPVPVLLAWGFCREGCGDGSGCCPALWRLLWGEVMDLMIQMKSLNCFMDDTNDTLIEFTVAVDV